jgi:hypothetical protein
MSKSRRAFLSLLQVGRTDYVINDAALAKMRTMNMRAARPLLDKQRLRRVGRKRPACEGDSAWRPTDGAIAQLRWPVSYTALM